VPDTIWPELEQIILDFPAEHLLDPPFIVKSLIYAVQQQCCDTSKAIQILKCLTIALVKRAKSWLNNNTYDKQNNINKYIESKTIMDCIHQTMNACIEVVKRDSIKIKEKVQMIDVFELMLDVLQLKVMVYPDDELPNYMLEDLTSICQKYRLVWIDHGDIKNAARLKYLIVIHIMSLIVLSQRHAQPHMFKRSKI
jgi:hypothetical protein